MPEREVPRAPGSPQRPQPEDIYQPEAWHYIDTTEAPPDDHSSNPSSYRTKTCKLEINYYKNGASGDPPTPSTITYSGEKKAVTLKRMVKGQVDSMVYTNRYFLGWANNDGANAPDYYPGDIITKTWEANESGTTRYNFYAKWSTTGRVIYKPGAYAKESSNAWHDKYDNKPNSGTVTLRGKTFTRTGYNQTGWVYDKGDTFAENERYIHYSLNQTVDVSDLPAANEIALYPEWQARTFTVTFRSSATGGETTTRQIQYDSDFTVPDDTLFSREGYHISLWNEDPNLLSATWYPGKTYVFQRVENITLYAIWAGNEYRVLYSDDENGSESDVLGIIESSYLALDENNCLYSTSESHPLLMDSNDNVNMYSLEFVIDTEANDCLDYDIAVYGSPFYTEYRPKARENWSFAGWRTADGTIFDKADHHMDAYCLPNNPTWNLMQNIILYPIWSGEYPFGKIFFGRGESSDYSIIVKHPPKYKWPERHFEHYEIRGKSGDVLADHRRYKNVEKEYEIAIYHKQGFEKAAIDLSEFLHRYDGHPGYVRLDDSYERDIFMLGVYEESGEMTDILGQAGEGTITFNCKPQKYLISGNKKIDIMSSPFTITNPTSYVALPIIKILGTGAIYFTGYPERVLLDGIQTLEAKTVELLINENSNEITIDCETFKAFNYNGYNAHPYILFDEQIALYPGENEIRYEGDIDKITIIPRWWRL